jgi:hypothetical protein
MAILLYEFQDFPDEQEAIGKMLIAYGEIEFALLQCLAAVLDKDQDHALRILFRVAGEGPRLAVADAIIRPAFAKLGLDGKWGNATGAARTCKNIRNQYAHCHWILHDKHLRFLNLDQGAQSPEGKLKVSLLPLYAPLVAQQLEFFEYTLSFLYWLEAEYQVKIGREKTHDLQEPKSICAPRLHSPAD